MCQLFGLNSAKPVAPHFSLRGFFRRGGGTDEHADGWGLAYYGDGHSHLRVRDTPAHQCADARAVLAEPFKTTHVIAHVRKATIGAVAIGNSHPFHRRLWDRNWVFAHNGDLKQFHPALNAGFRPVGETDSERAFCYLLTSLQERFGDRAPADDLLMEHIRSISALIARWGTFNFLLSDGRLMFAHCSTLLHWTARIRPEGQLQLVDDLFAMDLQEHDGPEVVIATRPLTRGEVWDAMDSGELKLFIDGLEAASMRTTPATSITLSAAAPALAPAR